MVIKSALLAATASLSFAQVAQAQTALPMPVPSGWSLDKPTLSISSTIKTPSDDDEKYRLPLAEPSTDKAVSAAASLVRNNAVPGGNDYKSPRMQAGINLSASLDGADQTPTLDFVAVNRRLLRAWTKYENNKPAYSVTGVSYTKIKR